MDLLESYLERCTTKELLIVHKELENRAEQSKVVITGFPLKIIVTIDLAVTQLTHDNLAPFSKLLE